MGIRDSIARRFGYEPASSIDTKVKDALSKQPTYIPNMGFGVFNQSNPGALAFSPSVVSGTGNNKAILTEFWINPLYGQPRLIDLRAVKQLARQNIGSMAIEKILDMIAQENWVIAPKPGKEDAFDKKHAELIVEFLHKPNRNNETFESILRKVIRGILETDDGTIVKVFDEYEEAADQRQASYGYPLDKFPTKDAQMIEMFAEDGSAFLKTVDMHQYLLNYWEYSYIIPRRPVAFRPREICYISANVRSGSPYGMSAFESIVDLLTFIIEAQKYNQRFYTNSSYPAFQLDLPNIKTREEMEAWGEWYRNNFMGPEKSFQALITNQNAKVSPLVFSPEAVQNLETQKWYLLLALAKLKIPPSILGFTEDANRAVAGQQTATFRALAIKPLEKIVERQFNQNIISELDLDGCCEFKFVEYTDLDEEERRSRIHSVYLDRGVISPNEVREEIGRGPIKNIVLDETVRQYNDRVRVEGMDYRRGQNIPNPKKPAATDSPSFQGHRDTDEGKDRPPRKYVGMCTECVESVWEDTKSLHRGHNIMSGGRLSKDT